MKCSGPVSSAVSGDGGEITTFQDGSLDAQIMEIFGSEQVQGPGQLGSSFWRVSCLLFR